MLWYMSEFPCTHCVHIDHILFIHAIGWWTVGYFYLLAIVSSATVDSIKLPVGNVTSSIEDPYHGRTV
jgi:hypothetical protein